MLADKAYAALAAGWERAGFDVELTGVPPEKYYKAIEEPASVATHDVFRGVWTPDLIDQADATTDPAARARVWVQADRVIRDDGGYIALAATKALHLHGATVRTYEDHGVGGIVDLATVSLR